MSLAHVSLFSRLAGDIGALALLLCALAAPATADIDVSGRWRVVVRDPPSTLQLELLLARNGTALGGQVTILDEGGSRTPGVLKITTGVLAGEEISFTAEGLGFAGPLSLTFDGTASADRITGTMDAVGGLLGKRTKALPFEATRVHRPGARGQADAPMESRTMGGVQQPAAAPESERRHSSGRPESTPPASGAVECSGAEACLRGGRTARGAENWRLAAAFFARAASFSDAPPAVWVDLGEARMAAGDYVQAGEAWDHVLAAGSPLEFRACLSGFTCKAGVMRLANDSLSFTSEKGEEVFRAAPGEFVTSGPKRAKVLLSGSTAVWLELGLRGKKWKVSFLPPGGGDCEKTASYLCPDPGPDTQEAVARYVKERAGLLATGRIALPPTPAPALADSPAAPTGTAQGAVMQQSPGGPPPLPHVEKDASLGEGHTGFVGWTTSSPVEIRTQPSDAAPVDATLPTGTRMLTKTAESHTIQYGELVVTSARSSWAFLVAQPEVGRFAGGGRQWQETTLDLKEGDRLYVANTYGEGMCRVWLKGAFYDTPCGNHADWARSEKELVKEVWSLVEDPRGRAGWLKGSWGVKTSY
jgi:hypothetical protein